MMRWQRTNNSWTDVQIPYRAQAEAIGTLRALTNIAQIGCNKNSEGLSPQRTYYPNYLLPRRPMPWQES